MVRLPICGPSRTKALTELSSDPLDSFPEFIKSVERRLAAGRQAYGDESFNRPVNELLTELEQETLDLAGWGFVLWYRIQKMKEASK